jgi:hypothetical protein
MSDFHDNYPSYETMAHHDEAQGKKIRRKPKKLGYSKLGYERLQEMLLNFNFFFFYVGSRNNSSNIYMYKKHFGK